MAKKTSKIHTCCSLEYEGKRFLKGSFSHELANTSVSVPGLWFASTSSHNPQFLSCL
uniref:Uncharacterized protein n=1 Tax=Rhizophora mucronata TaxID=61149 RepID=A0A2P2JB04_RHIMU